MANTSNFFHVPTSILEIFIFWKPSQTLSSQVDRTNSTQSVSRLSKDVKELIVSEVWNASRLEEVFDEWDFDTELSSSLTDAFFARPITTNEMVFLFLHSTNFSSSDGQSSCNFNSSPFYVYANVRHSKQTRWFYTCVFLFVHPWLTLHPPPFACKLNYDASLRLILRFRYVISG
jgi:hypothetical protein